MRKRLSLLSSQTRQTCYRWFGIGVSAENPTPVLSTNETLMPPGIPPVETVAIPETRPETTAIPAAEPALPEVMSGDSPQNLAQHLETSLPQNPLSLEAAEDKQSSGEPELPSPPPVSPQWGWLACWLAGFILAANGMALAIAWLTQLPQPLSCPIDSALASDRQRLDCARQLAQGGRLPQLAVAMATVEGWNSEHPLYPEAQRLLTGWSKSVLEIARFHLFQNRLQRAIGVTRLIPISSPVYLEAKKLADVVWPRNWEQGITLYRKIQTALQKQNWDQAEEKLLALTQVDNAYWRQVISTLQNQLSAEQQGRLQLKKARDIAAAATPARLANAITLARQLNPKLYVGAEALSDIQTWIEAMTQQAKERVSNQDCAGALKITEQLPNEWDVGNRAKEIRQFCLVLSVATRPQIAEASLNELISQTYVAFSLSDHLPRHNTDFPPPLVSTITDQRSALEQRWQKLLYLKSLSTIANVEQVPILNWVTQQADQIPQTDPLYLQAQRLATRAEQRITRLQDQQTLERAKQIAAMDTLEALEQAIALVKSIQGERPLHNTATAYRQAWEIKQRLLDDQRRLEQAAQVARSGNPTEALALLRPITADRPLYAQAQAMAQDIQLQLQLADDRRTLAKAEQLAQQKKWTEAIQQANTIEVDRELYSEAQAAIQRWLKEREMSADSEAP